jgi:hypothetical protein
MHGPQHQKHRHAGHLDSWTNWQRYVPPLLPLSLFPFSILAMVVSTVRLLSSIFYKFVFYYFLILDKIDFKTKICMPGIVGPVTGELTFENIRIGYNGIYFSQKKQKLKKYIINLCFSGMWLGVRRRIQPQRRRSAQWKPPHNRIFRVSPPPDLFPPSFPALFYLLFHSLPVPFLKLIIKFQVLAGVSLHFELSRQILLGSGR